MTASPSPRRLGATDSTTRAQLLEAAEQLMFDEGYAAVTSRHVAARAGLKPQLVHYYFRTMDDLFVELFRSRAEINLARFERAIAADGSLRNLWRVSADPRGAAFALEFVALAKHRKPIRAEIARYAQRFRDAQLTALTEALEINGIDQIPPVAVLMLLTGLTQTMALEQTIGMTAGHDATVAFVDAAIERLEAGGGEA